MDPLPLWERCPSEARNRVRGPARSNGPSPGSLRCSPPSPQGERAKVEACSVQILFGPLTRFGVASRSSPACSIRRASSICSKFSISPPTADPARAVLRLHSHPQHRHQLRPVPDARAARAMGAAGRSRRLPWRCSGSGWRGPAPADRAGARPDHRRRDRQRHRPVGLWLRSPTSCFSTCPRDMAL